MRLVMMQAGAVAAGAYDAESNRKRRWMLPVHTNELQECVQERRLQLCDHRCCSYGGCMPRAARSDGKGLTEEYYDASFAF